MKRSRRDSSAPFRAIAEFTYDWESWVAPDGRTRWINPAVERMTGRTVEECLAMPEYPLPIVVPDDRPRVAGALAAAAEGVPGNDLEFRVQHTDGTWRWVAMSWQSIRGPRGRALGYRTSVRDIDERKAFEERLREAKARAEAADKAKTAFLAGVSHELRTPLHAIVGHVELLKSEVETEAARRRVGVIDDQAALLASLVDDLLDLAGAELGRTRVDVAPVDVAAVVGSVVEGAGPEAARQKVALDVETREGTPGAIHTDARRLAQILRNLVDNAVRASPGGRVSIRIAPDDAGVRIVVEDTGVGFDVTSLDRLVQPFEQGDDGTRGRMGLGLPIAYRLADVLGIAIDVVSHVGKGTRFDLVVPSGAPGHALAETVATDPRVAGLRVLVVDDTEISRDLLVEALSRRGCSADSAADGEGAVRACRDARYDLVLMDFRMPETDGLLAAHRIRAEAPRGRRPRIVLLTADPTVRSAITEGDVDAFLEKPLASRSLDRVLARIVDADPLPIRVEATDRRTDALDADVIADLRGTIGSSGDPMLARVVDRVIADNRAALERLDSALARDDRAESARLAHRIAGNCLLVGARAAASLAQALETTVATGRRASAPTARELGQACIRLEDTLRSLRNSP